MCNDISLSATLKRIIAAFQAKTLKPVQQTDFNFEPSFHRLAQSFPRLPIFRQEEEDVKVAPFEWGVIPNYFKTPEDIRKGRKWMVNARSEKLLEKSAYWSKIRTQRCLVPATGFFEHREVSGWKNKVPYFIRPKGAEVFFMAGLYAWSPFPHPETGELTGTFSIITRNANEVMKKIHNGGENSGRMPLMMAPGMETEWLRPGLTDTDIQQLLQYELPSDALEYWPVNPVRRTKEDDASVIAPAQYHGLPPLDGNPPPPPPLSLFPTTGD